VATSIDIKIGVETSAEQASLNGMDYVFPTEVVLNSVV
jgi:hypothetical protein